MPTTKDGMDAPLYIVLGRVTALWIVANAGYFVIFPLLGYGLSYNSAPIAFALYFLVWAAISAYDLSSFVPLPSSYARVWKYALTGFGCAFLVWGLLYLFSFVPVLYGPLLAPYSDILFATPWYFLPKSAEVLVQQILISALVYTFAARLDSLKQIMLAYAATFGSVHLLMFFVGSPTAYTVIMTTGALLSTFIFPYLILRVERGFIYTYTIHLIFYILLAMTLHSWPPPGYGFL